MANPGLIAGLVVLTLLAMVVITRPWWRRVPSNTVARKAANIAAYKGRLAEIDREAAAGLIPAEDADSVRKETAARLLVDTEGLVSDDHIETRSARGGAIVVALFIGVFAGLWYWQAGSWRQLEAIHSPPPAADEAAMSPQVQAMVEKLADKLKANPDDAQGWAMLGRSYFVLHRYLQAADAYREANARNGGKNADTLAGQGEALAFANGTEVSPEAADLFDRALAVDPEMGPALWYGGLADAQQGNFTRARERWTRLRKQELPQQMRDLVDREMSELEQAQSGSGAEAAGAEAPATVAGAPAGNANAAPAASPVSIHLTVRLAPALAAKVPANALLFVFAKAASGPPMPLAVSRQPVGKWPVTLTLDDGMAMAPSLKLSAFDQYQITARVSASGQAMAQSGDLQGSLQLSRDHADKPVELLIDNVAP